ncbi:MAG TPA: Ig-like domain-containing protein, partial [Kamptonema sp.]|nr:Ig-like domain-containing protein [Kamptonema sp.]
SEAIKKGSGNIVIKKLSDNSIVETIAVTAANVTISGSQVTINPTADLVAATDYYVEIANGAIKDLAGNSYSGFTGNSTWNFTTAAAANAATTDTTPPRGSSFNPVDNATGVAVGSNLVFTLNEAIQKGSGNIVIKKLSDNSIVETIAVTAANVTISGSQLTINPTADLVAATDYYVEIANGAIKDLAGNSYSGFTGNSTWNFKAQGTAAINGTTGADNLTGTAGADNLTGTANENVINGLAGQDTLTGGTGADTFIFQFGESSVSASDLITDFAIGSDKIDLLTQGGAAINAPSLFSRAANSTATTLENVITQVFTDVDGALAGNQALGINSSALVVATTGSIADTYLVINDGNAGFQASNDLVINLTGYTGTLPPLGNTPSLSL